MNMRYKVRLTDNAIRQMHDTVAYISKELSAPDTASKWLDKMEKEIASLDYMPKSVPLIDEEPWRSNGIRKTAVDNFLIYFWIDDTALVVWVTAVVLGHRNQKDVLESMSLQ